MRKLIVLSLLISTAAIAHEHADTQEKKFVAETVVETTDAGSVYGAILPKSMPVAIDLDTAVANADQHAGKPAAFSGRITKVCQKMGCWVVLTSDSGKFARVTMHEHAFGVPKDSSGPAIVYGTLNEKTLSAKEIEHLKKDGAQPPSASEWQIDALSVVIPDAV